MLRRRLRHVEVVSVVATLLVVATPLDRIGVAFGRRLLPVTLVVAAGAASAWLLELLTGRRKPLVPREVWLASFVGFLLLAALSIVLSPFPVKVVLKGVIQIAGVSIMLLAVVGFARELGQNPALFVRSVRFCTIWLGLVASIGVLQFLPGTLWGPEWSPDFSFLNGLAGETVWWQSPNLGPLFRAHAFASEPQHFGTILEVGSGISLIRLGLLGRTYKQAITRTVPWWAAAFITTGMVVSFSITVYATVVGVVVSLWLCGRSFSRKVFARVATVLMLTLPSLYVIIATGGTDFLGRLESVFVIGSGGFSEGTLANVGGAENSSYVSALVLASNFVVTKSNVATYPVLGVGIGGHPVAYENSFPKLSIDDSASWQNSNDASSLLLRLLSEVGLLGTSAFVLGWLCVILRSRTELLVSTRAAEAFRPPIEVMALGIGMTASSIGVGLAYFARDGMYYDLPFWMSLAFTACIPRVLWEAAQARARNISAGRARQQTVAE